MLDAKMDNTANYRDTYAAVVDTCGPVATVAKPKATPASRDACPRSRGCHGRPHRGRQNEHGGVRESTQRFRGGVSAAVTWPLCERGTCGARVGKMDGTDSDERNLAITGIICR
jgi:hypothetical protein